MARVQETVRLDRPLEEVWGLFIDPDRWLAWNTELAGMRNVRGPFDHAGSGYTQVWRLARWEREGRWEVTACEPGRWREVAGVTPIGLAFEAREDFEDVADGSQVTVQIRWDTPGGALGRTFDRVVAEPMLRRALRANGRRIRDVLSG